MDVQNSCEVNRERARIRSGVQCDSTRQNGLVTHQRRRQDFAKWDAKFLWVLDTRKLLKTNKEGN